MRSCPLHVVLLVFAVNLGCRPGFAKTERLGRADFANSCNSNVQSQFGEAVLLLHSMEFEQAEKDFKQVETADPHCIIAAWGLALAETERSGANSDRKVLESGWNELKPWLARPGGSERERMYLDAVRAMYEGYQNTTGTVRWDRYLAGMEAIGKKYPDDVNAKLFYALGLVWTAGSGEKGLAQRRKALDILLPIFKEHPDNPGAAHYIIHAGDTPELASIALPAAQRYATIAPDSPHALHMPSHIFNRVGDWRDSVETNLASAKVAADWTREGRGGMFDEQHALNNLEYAYLQLGDGAKARSVISQIEALSKAMPGSDPWEPIDARIYFDVERQDWQDALTIEAPEKSPFKENFDVYWIRTIAEARLGRPEARTSLEQFRKSSAEWVSGHGWDDVMHLALAEAEAWTVYAEGRKGEGVRELTEAAEFEKDHPIYYADVLPRPASEMLGQMLQEMGEEKQACAAFQASLRLAPNTFVAVQGLNRCTHHGSGEAN